MASLPRVRMPDRHPATGTGTARCQYHSELVAQQLSVWQHHNISHQTTHLTGAPELGLQLVIARGPLLLPLLQRPVSCVFLAAAPLISVLGITTPGGVPVCIFAELEIIFQVVASRARLAALPAPMSSCRENATLCVDGTQVA